MCWVKIVDMFRQGLCAQMGANEPSGLSAHMDQGSSETGAQVGMGPKWVQAPSGFRPRVIPYPKWIQVPSGLWAQVESRPKGAHGPSGTGPHELSDLSVVGFSERFAQVNNIDMLV